MVKVVGPPDELLLLPLLLLELLLLELLLLELLLLLLLLLTAVLLLPPPQAATSALVNSARTMARAFLVTDRHVVLLSMD